MSSLRYSQSSRRDLVEIAEYIARDNPTAAFRILERFDQACQDLARTPSLGFSVEELPDNWRVWPVGSYLIIYFPEGEGVGIIRIVHGARDLYQFRP